MSYVDFYFTKMGRKILEIEARYIAGRIIGSKTLSIGCGPGLIEERIQQLAGGRIICADIDRDMLSQHPGNVEKIVCRAEYLPFKKEIFDTILFVTSLEFIDDYEKALKEGYRVLRKGGKAIILLLNQKSRYFKERMEKRGSYIARNIKHIDIDSMGERIGIIFFILNRDFIVTLEGNNVFEEGDEDDASIIAIEGVKK